MENIYGIIYKTTCLINGKIYIGQTVQLNNKSYIGSGSYLKSAIKKYGKENFIRETLKECYNQIELDEWEDLLIWEYKSRDKSIGYNIAKGSVRGAIGEMSPAKLPEVRKKMSESRKGKKYALGYKHTDEWKKKMSEFNKGKTFSDNTRKKLSEAARGEKNHRFGTKHTEEWKKKISKSSKEFMNRPEIKEKQRKAMKKIMNRPEIKEKMLKAVLQYDKQGNFIAEYYGVIEASRQTGINKTSIASCCRGRLHTKSAGGYIWKYKQPAN